MALITVLEVKVELDIPSEDTDPDTLLGDLLLAIVSLFEEEINRILESDTYTEYHSMGKHQNKLFLKNYPITSIISIHDDPDWAYGSGDLLSSSDYSYREDDGLVYYDGYFYSGFNNVKVVYVAGYTDSTLTKSIKQCLLRQISHWYKDAKGAEWAKSNVSQPGGGTVFKKELKKGLLPDFFALAEKYWRSN